MKQSSSVNLSAVNSVELDVWAKNASTEEQWALACTKRLLELRPSGDREALRALALGMARDLSYFDPVIAAEMEHEGGLLDG